MDSKSSKPNLPVSNPLITSMKQEMDTWRDQCNRMERDHAREIKRYQERANQGDARVQELVREKAALQNQAMNTERELKTASQTEASLRLALEKAEEFIKRVNDKGDNFAALQRKLFDLQKIHEEGKKNHHIEVERLTTEVSRSKKALTESSDQISLLQKGNEGFQARISDLKKAVLSGEKEIQDLRTKLRNAEGTGAKGQLALKQSEIDQLTKAVTSLEAQKREAIRASDAKTTEVEKALAIEKKRREGVEVKLREVTSRPEKDARDIKAKVTQLESEILLSKTEASEARAQQQQSAESASRLADVQAMFERVSYEYGRLAHTTISRAEYERLRFAHATSQLRCNRMERKLADREAQVGELVHLIRQGNEERELLKTSLIETEAILDDVRTEITSAEDERKSISNYNDLRRQVDELILLDHSHMIEVLRAGSTALNDLAACDRVQFINLYHAHRDLDRLSEQEYKLAGLLVTHLSTMDSRLVSTTNQLESIREEKATADEQLVLRGVELEAALERQRELQAVVHGLEEDQRRSVSMLESALKEEKDRVKKLTGTVAQKSMAEEAFKWEIKSMQDALDDATRFEAAHAGLLKEVAVLVNRNVLAEEEAEHLSQFNAEILGHQNVNQRIYYVDRIRKELAETKQKLITVEWERDNVAGENDELRVELNSYKSVALPINAKPRTSITRVERPPLAPRSLNSSNSLSKSLGYSYAKMGSLAHPRKELESVIVEEDEENEGLMTLEELM